MLQQKQIVPVRALDGYIELCLELRSTADVIHVTVGQPDPLYDESSLGDCTLDLRQISPGIDDNGMVAGLAPQHRAVLLEGGNRDDDSSGFDRGHAAPGRAASGTNLLRILP